MNFIKRPHGKEINLTEALEKMEKAGIIRPMIDEELRPHVLKQLEHARYVLDELIFTELEKRLKS